jgi:hypothetical protein
MSAEPELSPADLAETRRIAAELVTRQIAPPNERPEAVPLTDKFVCTVRLHMLSTTVPLRRQAVLIWVGDPLWLLYTANDLRVTVRI